MSAPDVRERIAALMLPPRPDSTTRIGVFTLRPAQERTVTAILAAVREFGGALVADPPGTGKTILALAAARTLLGPPDAMHGTGPSVRSDGSACGAALVIAPAAVRTQWIEAAERARVAIVFTSLEALSRGASPGGSRVVIVDEAHHARTASTRRYARLAECCLGAAVLLLSATPVVNRMADRDALLALFLGARSAALTASQVARCVVRSDASAALRATGASGTTGDPLRPTVRRLGVIGRGIDPPGLARMIASLPPPLPLADGTHAAALIAMSLAMAWRSSLAALDAALRRRLQRGEAMRDLLRSGRMPSRELLRHWTLHDDATQLVLGALLSPTATGVPVNGALAMLDAHLAAVMALRDMVRPHRRGDALVRATAIRELACAHPERRLVVFARHAETVRALHSALRAEPGVVAIIGSRVLAAAGRWSRDEVLRAVGPRARALTPNEPRGIRILLATDVVAEGVEMQGVGIVVHADIPWTPARIEQRIGRLTRAGSLHREVLDARLGAPPGARELIALGARLHRKSDARVLAMRDARAHAAITAIIDAWHTYGQHGADQSAALPPVRVGAVRARHDAFIAVVDDPPRWLAGLRREGRWKLSSSPARVLRVLRLAGGEAIAVTPDVARTIERLIGRASSQRAARALVSQSFPTSDSEPSAAHAEPPISRHRIARVRARLARVLAHAPSLARAEIAARQSALLARLSRPLERAREQRLDAVLRAELDDATFVRRLGALLHDDAARNDESRPGAPARLHCLLILTRGAGLPAVPEPARPSTSPGTAAPR